MIIVLAIVAVLVVAGGATGIIVATSGKKKSDTHQTTSPTTAPTGSNTQDFPAGQTDLPTDTVSGETTAQDEVAHNAEAVLHAIAADDSATFCPLIDPTDLKKLLKEKELTSCSEIKLKSSADGTEYKAFAVSDPTAIKVTGDTAHIPASAITPASFGAVDMRKDADGNWKFRFYSS
jgi:hypothetical protein